MVGAVLSSTITRRQRTHAEIDHDPTRVIPSLRRRRGISPTIEEVVRVTQTDEVMAESTEEAEPVVAG